MNEPRESGPVFIVGSPRSGTTILAWALGQHSRLWTGGELHLLTRLFGDGMLQELVRRELLFPGVLQRADVTAARLMAHLGSGFASLMQELSGGRRWVDQTPGHVFMVETLLGLFPDARFVHLLRDGRACVESMFHYANAHTNAMRASLEASGSMPDWAGHFNKACDMWVRSVEAAGHAEATHQGEFLTFRYSVLSDDPEALFRDITEFLGLADQPGPARYAQAVRINSSFSGDQPRRVPWRDWAEAEKEYFRLRAGPSMERHFGSDWESQGR